MENKYASKINLMVENYSVLKKAFRFQNDYVSHLIALHHAGLGRKVDIKMINHMMVYIKDNTKMFSIFRDMNKYILSGLLSTINNPTEVFDNILRDKEVLVSLGFKKSTYLPCALYAISTFDNVVDTTAIGKRAMTIFREMKKNHPFLTTGDDYPFAILLANSDRNIDLLEEYYKEMNNVGFRKSNGLQLLSHIMAFNNTDVQTSVSNAKYIKGRLKESGINIYPEYYPAIGLITLVENNIKENTEDLIYIAKDIKGRKGYRLMSKGMHVIMAAFFITQDIIKSTNISSSALNVSIQTLIIAQNAVMIGAIAGASAAAASS